MEKPGGVDPKGIRSVIQTGGTGQAEEALHRRRHAAAAQQEVPGDHPADSRRPDRRDRRGPGLLERRRHARLLEMVGQGEPLRHGVAVPELAVVHLDQRRPHRRAARAQSRRHQLGPAGTSGAVHGHGRPGRPHPGQHLRPLRGRVRVRQGRAGREHVPPDQRQHRPDRRARRGHQGRTPTSITASSRARSRSSTTDPIRTTTSRRWPT